MEGTSDSQTPEDTNFEPSPSPVNEEPLIPSDDKTVSESTALLTDVPTTTSDNGLANKQNTTKDSSMEKTAPTNKQPSKPNKPAREKNGGNTANASGTSRKGVSNSQAGLVGDYVIEPDPKVNKLDCVDCSVNT